MKSLKVIPLLDSIPNIPSYSNYGTSLERIFKMSSLQYLIKSLKFRKDYLKQIEKKSTDINNNNEYDIFDLQKKWIRLEYYAIIHSQKEWHQQIE